MARQPLVIGTWGTVKRETHVPGRPHVVSARFRDYDGITRAVERTGKSHAAAERALIEALRDRSKLHAEDLTPDTRLNVVADAWLVEFAALDRAEGTRALYGRALGHVRRGMGGLQLRECTVPAVDRFLKAISKSSGPGMGQTCRVVSQGVLALAVRQGAIAANPVRDAAPITKPRKPVRALDVEAVAKVRAELKAWDAGVTKNNHPRTTDLADVVDMILATGVRSGEVLSIAWDDIDLASDPCTVAIHGTVTWVTGKGLIVQPHPKTETSERGLQLPQFAVDMLMRRMVAAQSTMVFPSSLGTLRSPNNFRRQWRDFRAASGYESWVVPKTFRKAVATLVKAEAGLSAAADQLGHSGSAVTAKHYVEQTHVGPDVRDILQRFAS